MLKDTGQEGLFEARYRLARFKVEIAEATVHSGDADFPAGSWIFPRKTASPTRCTTMPTELGLDFVSVAARRTSPRHAAQPPGLGCGFPGLTPTPSAGFANRSISARVPYTYLRDEDIRAGNLRKKIDVLLYGHVDLELAEQIQGIPKAWGPMPFKKTAQTPSFGTPAASDDITGGIGWEGLAQIQQFVEQGGLMVTLGNGSHAAHRRRHRSRRASRLGRRAAQPAGGGAASAAAAQDAVTRTPGAHVRVTFARQITRSPTAIRKPAMCSARISRSIDAPALAAHGLLHQLPGRALSIAQRGDAVGRP